MKKYWVLFLFSLTNILLWADAAYAQKKSASAAFDKGTSILDDMLNFLQGKFAIGVIGIAIAVAAILLITGRLTSVWAWRIIGGSALLGSAGELAMYLMER